MPYVKAQVTEEVQRALNMEASKHDTTVSAVAGQELQAWYYNSDYDLHTEDGDSE